MKRSLSRRIRQYNSVGKIDGYDYSIMALHTSIGVDLRLIENEFKALKKLELAASKLLIYKDTVINKTAGMNTVPTDGK